MSLGLPQRGSGLRAELCALTFRILTSRILTPALLGVITGAIVPGALAYAESQPVAPLESSPTAAASEAKPQEQPRSPDTSAAQSAKPEPANSFKATVRALVEEEARKAGLPADIADAVIYVESNYDPSVIGRVGEVGLMQVRPETAAMLGFRGTNEELAKPEINIHYGVVYLSKALRLANGDLCRALMKYRAGHGEEIMTPRSVDYCLRARNHLASVGSPFASLGASVPLGPAPMSEQASNAGPKPMPASSRLTASPKDVYAGYKRGTAAASRAFWAAHEARVHAISAEIEAKWRHMASR